MIIKAGWQEKNSEIVCSVINGACAGEKTKFSLSCVCNSSIDLATKQQLCHENNQAILFIQLCIAKDARLQLSFVTSPGINFERDFKRLRRKMN
jgi:hypothetical protein